MPTSSSPGCVSMRSLKAVASASSSKAYRKFTKPGKAAPDQKRRWARRVVATAAAATSTGS